MECIHNFIYDGKDGRYPYKCTKCPKRTADNYYTYPVDAIPEINYTEPQVLKHRCGNCNHGITTNPGANIPGYACKIMKALFKKRGYVHGMDQVDQAYGKCDFYNHPFKKAIQELTPAQPDKT